MNVFIAGARAVTNLDAAVVSKLYSIYEKGHTVLVGDACGVDASVQKFYAELGYGNVVVYASAGRARNNVGGWTVQNAPVRDGLKGFDFYRQKDIAMANDADCGLMIWNGESRGALNNIVGLLRRDKPVAVYLAPKNTLANIDSFDKLEALLAGCPASTQKIYERLTLL
jgi:hypothetical protein